MIARVVRAPATWAAVSALSIALAASLPSTAPGWLFWGAVGLSCAAAALWAWLQEASVGR